VKTEVQTRESGGIDNPRDLLPKGSVEQDSHESKTIYGSCAPEKETPSMKMLGVRMQKRKEKGSSLSPGGDDRAARG